MFRTRITWPTGSASGKSVFATVAPRRQTFSATSTSRAVKFAPSAMAKFRTARKSSFPPSIELFQLLLPAMSCARPRTPGVHRPIVGTSRTIASASSMVRVVMDPEPPWARPGPPKLPAER